MTDALEIKNLTVEVSGKTILEDISITIKRGDSHILFGPNGSGKTSLLLTLMGYPGYEVKEGSIIFSGEDITKRSVDERARLGIGIGFQMPQEIRGIKLADLLKICAGKKPTDGLSPEEKDLVEKFKLTKLLERDVNLNFSGGEKKRAEILQLLLMKPKLLLLDEPDSGVDPESLKMIGKEIQDYLEENDASALVITHQGDVLEQLKSENACVLVDKRIHCRKKPRQILEEIRKRGYKKCVTCPLGQEEQA